MPHATYKNPVENQETYFRWRADREPIFSVANVDFEFKDGYDRRDFGDFGDYVSWLCVTNQPSHAAPTRVCVQVALSLKNN
jgi:hypothetical protein